MSNGETAGTGKPYGDDDKIFLFLAYFGILALVPFLMYRDKKADPQKEFVYWHGRQGLALALCVLVLCVVMMVLGFALAFIPVIGWLLSCLLWICILAIGIGGAIMGWIKAFDGLKWEMPGVCKVAAMFN